MAARTALAAILALAAMSCAGLMPAPLEPGPATAPAATFRNPICPRGADPQVVLHEGAYHYVKASAGQTLTILKSRDVTAMATAERKVVWTAPKGTSHSRELWAPELHQLGGKWYIYYAADDGNNDNHRLYVLENASADPMRGEFVMKGRLKTDADDHWAIDATVFEQKGQLYVAWSGWPAKVVTTETSCIYIARMDNPWTIGSDRVAISKPELDWERHWQNPPEWHNTPGRPVFVNEGPAFLRHGDKIFLTYSASACWTPFYCLGMLTADADANLLDPASWKKSPTPVFQQSPADGVYGTGHNSFFQSPDGKEDWLIYHANEKPEECGGPKRSPRIQKVEWNADGTPNFGKPLPLSEKVRKPSGL